MTPDPPAVLIVLLLVFSALGFCLTALVVGFAFYKVVGWTLACGQRVTRSFRSPL